VQWGYFANRHECGFDAFGKKIAANPSAIVTSAARKAIQRSTRSRGCSTSRVTGETSRASIFWRFFANKGTLIDSCL
jgi:hypothetical protein